MKRVEIIQLNKTKELSQLCHLCKNLYNLGNYYINMNYEIMEEYLNWYDTKWMLKFTELWKELPAQVAQNILKSLHLNWKSYFQALKDWKKNPKKYKRRPNPPNYLRKEGEFIACFNHQHINIKKNKLYFPKKTCLKPIHVISTNDDLQQVRIIPKNDIYNLELVYNHIEKIDLELDKERIIAIDLGVNNLACIVNNIGLQSFIINGKPLKSINHYYNKEVGKLQSQISKQLTKECEKMYQGKIFKKNGKYTKRFVHFIEQKSIEKLRSTKRMKKLQRIRNNKIKDYLHKTSRYIIDYCIENNIGTIVIGWNPTMKEKISLGKRNNQKIVQIPFKQLIDKIQYKADFLAINCKIITEEYTSLCSFLDNETIEFHEKYQGQRISRGLFKISNGKLINADVNGAFNIMKKAFPKAINVDGIKDAQLHPIRINLNTKSKLTPINLS